MSVTGAIALVTDHRPFTVQLTTSKSLLVASQTTRTEINDYSPLSSTERMWDGCLILEALPSTRGLYRQQAALGFLLLSNLGDQSPLLNLYFNLHTLFILYA